MGKMPCKINHSPASPTMPESIIGCTQHFSDDDYNVDIRVSWRISLFFIFTTTHSLPHFCGGGWRTLEGGVAEGRLRGNKVRNSFCGSNWFLGGGGLQPKTGLQETWIWIDDSIPIWKISTEGRSSNGIRTCYQGSGGILSSAWHFWCVPLIVSLAKYSWFMKSTCIQTLPFHVCHGVFAKNCEVPSALHGARIGLEGFDSSILTFELDSWVIDGSSAVFKRQGLYILLFSKDRLTLVYWLSSWTLWVIDDPLVISSAVLVQKTGFVHILS